MASFQSDPGATWLRCYADLLEDIHPKLTGAVVSEAIDSEVYQESDPKTEAWAEHKRLLAAEEPKLNVAVNRRAQVVDQEQTDQVHISPSAFNPNDIKTVDRIREEDDPPLSYP